ncbi:hypothetical protein KCU99_g67, partial [Aureobasidium melanogenum]
MTSFLFCNFSGFASLQLMRLMNRAQWLLPLDRRFLALPLTQAFETDSFSVSPNTQAIQYYMQIQTFHSGCRSFRSLPSPQHQLHKISAHSSVLRVHADSYGLALQSFLSTISPHACPSALQASPRAPCRNAPLSRISVSPICWQLEP